MTAPRTSVHSSIRYIVKALGCKSNALGICHGVAYMGMQAILAGENEVNTFNTRINFMLNMTQDALRLAAQQPRTEDELILIYKNYFDAKFAEWNKRASEKKKERLEAQGIDYNNMSASAIEGGFNDLLPTLTEAERKEWELLKSLEVFAQGIDLYLEPQRYARDEAHSGLFNKSDEPGLGDADFIIPLLQPYQADATGGIDIVRVDGTSCTTCRYFENTNALQLYLNNIMRSLVGKVNQPVAFTLTSGDHTITIGFNPVKQEYIFIDANSLPAKLLKDAGELALKIAAAFGPPGMNPHDISPTILNITAFASSNDPIVKENIKNAFNQPLNIPDEVRFDGGRRDQRSGFSWLDLASRYGHGSIAQQILDSMPQDRKRQLLNSPCGNTALTNAIHLVGNKTSAQSIEMVEILLKNSINPNSVNPNGTTQLQNAIDNNNHELVLILLKYGADPNLTIKANDRDWSPLGIAISQGNPKIIETLLKYGARLDDPVFKGGPTPVQYLAALHEKHDYMVSKQIETLLIETALSPDEIAINNVRMLLRNQINLALPLQEKNNAYQQKLKKCLDTYEYLLTLYIDCQRFAKNPFSPPIVVSLKQQNVEKLKDVMKNMQLEIEEIKSSMDTLKAEMQLYADLIHIHAQNNPGLKDSLMTMPVDIEGKIHLLSDMSTQPKPKQNQSSFIRNSIFSRSAINIDELIEAINKNDDNRHRPR